MNYRFLATPGVEVSNLAFASDDVFRLSWKSRPKSACLIFATPVRSLELTLPQVLASIRMAIYWLRENAIYCDTNSVIFIQPSAEPWLIATVENLGDMQSELKPCECILEFASGG
jgi:hypothetical protein